jgi:hypothetical protein
MRIIELKEIAFTATMLSIGVRVSIGRLLLELSRFCASFLQIAL